MTQYSWLMTRLLFHRGFCLLVLFFFRRRHPRTLRRHSFSITIILMGHRHRTVLSLTSTNISGNEQILPNKNNKNDKLQHFSFVCYSNFTSFILEWRIWISIFLLVQSLGSHKHSKQPIPSDISTNSNKNIIIIIFYSIVLVTEFTTSTQQSNSFPEGRTTEGNQRLVAKSIRFKWQGNRTNLQYHKHV